jgi:crotonobetainyl-CoA:carnitine CoA-transferase CaiB-like acyl-CoA transferase
MSDGPLSGVRVLEFSLIVAGPFLGMNLADLGADVIKVEPPEGEARRSVGVIPGTSKIYQWANRGKRSLPLDLKKPAARDLVHLILPQIDVVVTNYRPGVPQRLGIDYETLSAMKPDLIYANISGFGPDGPLAGAAAADMVAQAYSGAMAAAGKLDDDGAPQMIGGISLGDTAAGIGAAMGVCAALFHRERTGEGQLIESSLVHAAMALGGTNTMREATTDRMLRDPLVQKYDEVRASGGSYADLIVARGDAGPLRWRGRNYWAGYNASDGAIVFSANTVSGRSAIRRVLGFKGDGDDDPAMEPGTSESVQFAATEKKDIRHLLRERTVAEWMASFRAVGAPVAPVLLPEEVADDEQATEYFQDLVHPVTGPERQVKPIVSMSKTPTRIRATADMLGEHSAEILGELGLAPEEISELRKVGALG